MIDTLTTETSQNLFFRSAKSKTYRATSAEGCYVYDADGKRYFDGSGGAAVSNLGHNNPVIIEAIRKQLEGVIDTHNVFFTTDSQEQLSQHLFVLSEGHFARSIFCSSGSEAVEVSIKLARQYHCERGATDRFRVISRAKSYHGNTIGALSLSDIARGPMFQPYFQEIANIPAYFPYRNQLDNESTDEYGLRCANALEAEILRLGPTSVSAFIVETVVGSTLGAVASPPLYLKRIREICDQYGVLLIFDEVMCGAGRTGTFFAYEQELVRPDIIVMAKGLSGGHIPLSATCTTAEIHSVIANGSGVLGSNHTYMGHPLACAAGLGVMNVLRNTDMMNSVSTKGYLLMEKLHAQFLDHPHVDYIRGRGLFMAIELVSKKETKEAFPIERKVGAAIRQCALDNGLIIWTGQGSAEKGGDFILLAPPFIITEVQMDEMVDLLSGVIDTVLGC